MKAGQYIKALAEFVTGDIELSEFKQLVEERLFELRQEPEMTEEKKVLSSIELYLHESEEGQRSISEVYAHAQSILDGVILHSSTSIGMTERLAPVFPQIPFLITKNFDIDLIEENQTVIKDLRLVASK
jgi:hypothetical protein